MKNSEPIKVNFDFLTPGQHDAWTAVKRNQVTFLTGPAGTAKTFIATAYGLKAVAEWQRFERIVAIRPTVEAGERNGFLPGNLQEKVRPFMDPIFDIVGKLCGSNPKIKARVASMIKIQAIGYSRGLTFSDCVCIIDEAQNITKDQMTLILSRLGQHSKMIFCGDSDQTDIGRGSVLHRTAEIQSEVKGVGWHQFADEDNVRNPLTNILVRNMKDV